MRQLLIVFMLLATPAFAEGERAGDFDFYVLSLSWNSSWCELEGDARDADQCDPRHDYAFTLHGLWPQNETGWPSYCRTTARDPSRGQSAGMADIMGSSGLAWYQWKKHGRCAGLSAVDYYEAAREAFERVAQPEVLRKVQDELQVPPLVVKEAFLEANPGLGASELVVTCKAGMLQEVRVCLNKDLAFQQCGWEASRGCSAQNISLLPIR